MKRRFFKRHQREGVFNYYEVHDGGHITVSFLSNPPTISGKTDSTADGTTTADIIAIAEEITAEEYLEAYNRAMDTTGVIIKP